MLITLPTPTGDDRNVEAVDVELVPAAQPASKIEQDVDQTAALPFSPQPKTAAAEERTSKPVDETPQATPEPVPEVTKKPEVEAASQPVQEQPLEDAAPRPAEETGPVPAAGVATKPASEGASEPEGESPTSTSPDGPSPRPPRRLGPLSPNPLLRPLNQILHRRPRLSSRPSLRAKPPSRNLQCSKSPKPQSLRPKRRRVRQKQQSPCRRSQL